MIRTILVIEDDAETARFFSLVLERAGFTVEILRDGQLALNRLAGVKVIVATANPQMAEEVYDMADLVLVKPISYDQLRGLVQRFT